MFVYISADRKLIVLSSACFIVFHYREKPHSHGYILLYMYVELEVNRSVIEQSRS